MRDGLHPLAGALLLQFFLGMLLASDYPYIRLSGDNATHASTTLTASLIYAGLAAASVGCMWAQRPLVSRSTAPRGSRGA